MQYYFVDLYKATLIQRTTHMVFRLQGCVLKMPVYSGYVYLQPVFGTVASECITSSKVITLSSKLYTQKPESRTLHLKLFMPRKRTRRSILCPATWWPLITRPSLKALFGLPPLRAEPFILVSTRKRPSSFLWYCECSLDNHMG